MRMSGRKLRLAVGTGFAALMLMVGVSSVGATAPGTTGSASVVVGGGASAYHSSNPSTTVATYRDAPAVVVGDLGRMPSLGPSKDVCRYIEVGRNTDGQTVLSVDFDKCGNVVLQPAAFPLWEVVGGPGVGPTGKYFVVPETENPPNGTIPAKAYVIDTFR